MLNLIKSLGHDDMAEDVLASYLEDEAIAKSLDRLSIFWIKKALGDMSQSQKTLFYFVSQLHGVED